MVRESCKERVAKFTDGCKQKIKFYPLSEGVTDIFTERTTNA